MALNKELVVFLRWLAKQPSPVSQQTMVARSAPEYSSARIENLRTNGYIDRGLDTEGGSIIAVYSISDKGRQKLQARASDNRRWWVLFICQFFSTVIAIAAFVKSFFY